MSCEHCECDIRMLVESVGRVRPRFIHTLCDMSTVMLVYAAMATASRYGGAVAAKRDRPSSRSDSENMCITTRAGHVSYLILRMYFKVLTNETGSRRRVPLGPAARPRMGRGASRPAPRAWPTACILALSAAAWKIHARVMLARPIRFSRSVVEYERGFRTAEATVPSTAFFP